MARYLLIQDHARDGAGRLIPSATVQIYQADGTTPPTNMYTAKTGGSAITTGLTTAGTDGYFAIYIDDADHPLNTEFDMVITKTSYESRSYYDLRG